MTYEEQLKDKRWLVLRDEILQRDWHMCQKCMATTNLHVHHKRYYKELFAWEYNKLDLTTLCGNYHRIEHGIDEDGKDENDPFVRLPRFIGDLVRLAARMNKK